MGQTGPQSNVLRISNYKFPCLAGRQAIQNKMTNNKFDLEERTAVFAENVIDFCKSLKETTITKPIIS